MPFGSLALSSAAAARRFLATTTPVKVDVRLFGAEADCRTVFFLPALPLLGPTLLFTFFLGADIFSVGLVLRALRRGVSSPAVVLAAVAVLVWRGALADSAASERRGRLARELSFALSFLRLKLPVERADT